MKPLNLLKDLILKKVLLSDVLQGYQVEFMYDPNKADEVQFRCPIHGKDNKPSARFYKETQSCYCWVCHKRWDVISFIGDKESLSFVESIKHIVNKYKLDTSGLPDLDIESVKPKIIPKIDQKRQENIFIISIRSKLKDYRGKIPFEKYRALCGAFYMILYDQYKDLNVMPNLIKFESKLNRILHV